MKKLTALLMMLCLGMFVVGCGEGGDEVSADSSEVFTPDPNAEPDTLSDPETMAPAAADAAVTDTPAADETTSDEN